MQYATLLLVVLISGCATSEQIAQQQAYEVQQQEQRRTAYREGLQRQCRSMGFQDGTTAFSNCLLQLHTTNQQRDNALQNAVIYDMLRQK